MVEKHLERVYSLKKKIANTSFSCQYLATWGLLLNIVPRALPDQAAMIWWCRKTYISKPSRMKVPALSRTNAGPPFFRFPPRSNAPQVGKVEDEGVEAMRSASSSIKRADLRWSTAGDDRLGVSSARSRCLWLYIQAATARPLPRRTPGGYALESAAPSCGSARSR